MLNNVCEKKDIKTQLKFAQKTQIQDTIQANENNVIQAIRKKTFRRKTTRKTSKFSVMN